MVNIRAEGPGTDADLKAPDKKREPLANLRPIVGVAFLVAIGVTLAYMNLKDSEWWKEISETDLFRLWTELNNPVPDGAVTPPIEKPETSETPGKAPAEKPVEAGTRPEKPPTATASETPSSPSPKEGPSGPQESIQGPNGSELENDGPSGPQESIHGPNGSDVEGDTKPVEPQAPKATFVSDESYRTSELNLSLNGYAPISVDTPSQDDVWGLEDAADDMGVTLSNEEAELALQNGGFVKDGVTYEVWGNPDTGDINIVKCDADHRLVGNVPNFDANPVATPETDYGSESDREMEVPVDNEREQGVWFNGQWYTADDPRYDSNYEGGYEDGDYESGYDDRYYGDVYPYDPSDRNRNDYYDSRARIQSDYEDGYARSQADYYRGA